MDNLYAAEIAQDEEHQINLPYNPSVIPGPYDLNFPYTWRIINTQLDPSAYEPTVCTVECILQNFRYTRLNGYGPIDNHPGRLIWAGYSEAFLLARRRFNFKVASDENTQWLEDHPTATVMRWSNGRGRNAIITPGVEPDFKIFPRSNEEDYKNRKSRQQFSMVRVRIENMPTTTRDDDVVSARPMSSDNVYIRPNDDMFTVRRLYTSLVRKYFWQPEVEGLTQRGSEKFLFFPDDFEIAARDDIRILYEFMFMKGPNWTRTDNYHMSHEYRNVYARPNNLQAVIQGGDEMEYDGGDDMYFHPHPLPPPRIRAPKIIEYRAPSRFQPSRRTAPRPSPSMQRAVAERRQRLANIPYNLRQRNYIFGKVGGDDDSAFPYARMKDQIYIKRNVGDFFIHSKACIATPETPENLCFPMAFMRCQKRTWVHKICNGQPTSEMDNIVEGQVFDLFLDDIELPEGLEGKETSFFSNNTIHIFDCTKKLLPRVGSHGRQIFMNEARDLEEWEIQLWKWCAFQVHEFVQQVCNVSIDYTDMEQCLHAYAYTFELNISVYAMELRGERIHLECLHSLAPRKEENFIGLILQKDHVHAISHNRAYHKSEINPSSSCLHTYCDFCNTMSHSRTRAFAHTNKCFISNKWKTTPSLETLHEEDATKLELRKKYNYLPENKKYQNMCTTCYFSEEDCNCPHKNTNDWETRGAVFIMCKICSKEIPLNHYNDHHCYMKARKPKNRLDDNKIFVYDIESMQTYNENCRQYIHEAILICLRAVYNQEERWYFENIRDFVLFLMDNPRMHGSVILSLNGGGYDNQFVLRYLEDNLIMHTTIPRPNTLHKYLSLTITMNGGKSSIEFLDFMMMMTDSLKNIGKAFKLPICKGEFPHKFSTADHLNYCGRLPPLDSEQDWYGFKEIQKPADLEECKEYWKQQSEIYCSCDEECICGKPKWNFKEQLLEYCWKDVDVLAGACKAYRDQALNFSGSSDYSWATSGIEPFQYMTQSQIALALFLQGREQNNIAITHEKIRTSFNPKQVLWLDQLNLNPMYEIQHAGNSFTEYYDIATNTYFDGYCKKSKTVFEYLDCYMDGCYHCYSKEIEGKEMHPHRHIRWDYVAKDTAKRLNAIRCNNRYNFLITHWSHEDVEYPEYNNRNTIGNLMKLRDFFYGGRTEVFAGYADALKYPDMEILHHDVCSLYPYVCSWKELPIGIPNIYFNRSIEKERLHPNHPDRYFGFARIRIKPNTKDLIAVLPQRIAIENGPDKLVYDLLEKEGCWHTELIYLAMERQYEVLDIYEVWHWPTSQRSSTLMRGYMEFFLRMKQEAEGWEKLGKELFNKPVEEYTEEDKNSVADMIFNNNGGFARPRLDKVEKNPVLRQLAKIFLNCLWGKLCQKNASEYEKTIYGYKQYLEIMTNPLLDPESLKFRHVNGSVFKVRYKVMDTLQETNRFLNIPIAASVTAHAQVVLMRQMFVIGPERVLYCDTDSIMFFREKGASKLNRSGLGNWEDEHPGQVITRFWALAPKCYLMEIKSTEEVEYYLRCKGVRSNEENRKRTSFDKIHQLVEDAFLGNENEGILANTMTIHPNSTNSSIPYGLMCTCYGTKRIQIVYSKRELIKNKNPNITKLNQLGILRLVPYGYDGDATHGLSSTY